MANQRTFSIIKPDAVEKNAIGSIIARFESEGLRIVALRKTHLSALEAKSFYAEHRERPFFPSLVEYMTSGPVVLMVLEGENAVLRNREIMGPTNAAEAPADTIRGQWGESIERNAVHGSDAPETAAIEIGHFFSTSALH